MKQKVRVGAGFLVLLLLATLVRLPGHAAAFAGGTGTVSDPYQIADCTQLQAMGSDLTASYELVTAIDCTATSGWNSGAGFVPVGSDVAGSFQGNFNGNFYPISHLHINRPTTDDVALFGFIDSSVQDSLIQQVVLTNVSITGRDKTGALIGNSWMGKIEYSSSTGTVVGRNSVGGLVGYNSGGHLTQSFSSADVTGSSASGDYGGTGGLAGLYDLGSLSQDYATGDVSGNYYVGDLAGRTDYTGPVDSYATGDVSGTGYVGGLTGMTSTGNIKRSYATGDVTSTGTGTQDFAGGLNGVSDGIDSSFALGTVTAPISNPELGSAVMGSTLGSGIHNDYYDQGLGLFCYGGLASHTDDPDCTAIGLTAQPDYFNDPASAIYTTPYSAEVWDVNSANQVWFMPGNALPTLSFISEPEWSVNATRTTTSITVSWPTPVHVGIVLGFELQHKKASDSSYTTISSIPGTATSYTVNNLTPDTEYDFNPRYFSARLTSGYIPFTTSTLADTSGSNSSTPAPTTPKVTTASASVDTTPDDTSNGLMLNDFPEYIDGSGKSLDLQTNDVLHFTVKKDGEVLSHTATVKEIGANYVVLTIASTTFDITLELNQPKVFTVDDQSVQATLTAINAPVASVTFAQMKPAPRPAEQLGTVTPPATTKPKNKAWAWWILGILGALVLLIILSRLWRSAQQANERRRERRKNRPPKPPKRPKPPKTRVSSPLLRR